MFEQLCEHFLVNQKKKNKELFVEFLTLKQYDNENR